MNPLLLHTVSCIETTSLTYNGKILKKTSCEGMSFLVKWQVIDTIDTAPKVIFLHFAIVNQ